MLQIAVVIGYVILFGLFIKSALHHHDSPEEPEPPEDFDAIELKPEVERLLREMNRLSELDGMLIDLRLCPEDYQRTFRMEWQGAAGNRHAIDILTDGADVSGEYLTELALAERDQVNADCIRMLRAIGFHADALDAESKAESKAIDEGEGRE